MGKEIKSFQENIRRTFIVYSLTPVIAITTLAMVLFVATWFINVKKTTKDDCVAISKDINSKLQNYELLLEGTEDIIQNQKVTEADDDFYRLLYEHTADYGELGDFFVLTHTADVVFSSKGSYYKFLTTREYMNWGVFKAVKSNPDKMQAILFDDKLCLAKGVKKDGFTKYFIVYVVPKEVIQQSYNETEKLVCITDAVGWIYTSNNKKIVNSFGQVKDELEKKVGIITIDGHRYYSAVKNTDDGLKVYVVSDIDRGLRLIEILFLILAFIFMFIIGFSYRNAGKSSIKYTKDVKEIEDAFEAVKEGDFDVSLTIDSSKELQTIGNDFNEMLEGLKTQIARNKELAENMAFAQVKQLESQFNPHFLFNTLDNIRFMAKIDSAAADKMIVSLSGLLRYTIRETREEVTVKEDLEYLQYYLNILQIRFNKRFAYTLDVSEDISDYLIPKLVVQPLLENAIKYGFGDKEKLTVNLRGYQDKDNLIFECEDDGVGMAPELLEEIKAQLFSDKNTSTHLGLYNIHRRITLMYKQDCGLSIQSTKGVGTKVRVTIPKH